MWRIHPIVAWPDGITTFHLVPLCIAQVWPTWPTFRGGDVVVISQIQKARQRITSSLFSLTKLIQ